MDLAVDLAAMAARLGRLLREAGVQVSPDQLGRFVRSMSLTAPATSDDLYWLGRITLLSDQTQIEIYDAVFGHLFRGLPGLPQSDGADAPPSPVARDATPDRNPSAADPDGEDEAGERQLELVLASREERLATTDFAELTDDELRELRALMRRIRLDLPLRRARRHHRHRRGDRLDLRATLRRSRRTAGDPVERVATRARCRRRRLVVLCDISGSMAPYSRACIQMLHAATTVGPHAEVFTFATRLTRLTRSLSVANADAALAAAAATAPDWNGGTRIGAALKDFLDRFGRRGIARGAVVVVVSDGWDRDDPHLVGEQMARLRRLAHRIIWINPRTAADGYAPLAGGMAAALPHCDHLASGHTLTTLGEAMSTLSGP
jgi:uncharacterized protein